ncbi:uncharacterized protein LOC132754940, partial [Ruditapes philippinarum]|uniref:uncharacterized protein LOC132754940 n=1 Tax=Ruditapes philippinarum TaxID=129788 RepID=UPI00295B619B
MAAKTKVDFGGENNELLQEADFKVLMKHKTEFLDLVTFVETQKLVAITISNCNAMYNYSFTDAQVQRRRNMAFVFYKTLFEIEILKHFFMEGVLPDGMEAQKRTAVLTSLKFLAKYLTDYDHDKEVLQKYSDGSVSEVEWASILAAHLLKKLAPKRKTILSDDGYAKLQGCPCKCGTILDFGDTSLGNPSVWHGSVDTICNGNIVIDIDHTTTATEMNISVEKESRISHQRQILAESIVTSFAIKRPAPLISISRNQIQLFMYIPDSDILLEGAPVILTVDNQFQLKAVLFVWLLLNYNVFKEDLSKTIRSGMPVSNFKTLVGDKLG